MRRLSYACMILAFLLTFAACRQERMRPSGGDWPESTVTAKPWTRWWWMGDAVDRKDLGRLLEKYHRAGFGGVEITPIYGAKGYEDASIEYLSPEWMDMLHYTIRRAHREDMEVDMNLGTGWPFGGPQITPEYAASRLIIKTFNIESGSSLPHPVTLTEKSGDETGSALVALTACNEKGTRLLLTDSVDRAGFLHWTAGQGNWTLYAAFCQKTGQKVKRAAKGGEGYTMDPFSEAALDQYLQRFDSAFDGREPGIRSYFNDSYEVYGADYSPGLFDCFRNAHGYDIRLYLKELAGNDPTDLSKRIRADYRATLGEMLLDHFTRPWTAWAHSKDALTRNQAHGSPGNLLDLYAAVDIPECETFGYTRIPIPGLHRYTVDTTNVEPDPVMLKFASSAGDVMGKPLLSSETFTWLGEHFKVPLSECKPQADVAFLAGVNHIFYHGTPYSPSGAGWPGWLFYASVNFSPSNSFWPHIGGLNAYITRCQSVLQAGLPDNDILVYWPIEDVWHSGGKPDMQLGVNNIDTWLQPTPFYKLIRALLDRGYTMDYVSDRMVRSADVLNGKIRVSPGAPFYKAIVVPETGHMPLATLRSLIRLADSGARIIFEKLPGDVPGFGDTESRRDTLDALLGSLSSRRDGNVPVMPGQEGGALYVSDNVTAALQAAGIEGEALSSAGLRFVRRIIDGDSWYYIVNQTSHES